MELTVVQRRLFELVGKTIRILLITEFYESCSKVLDLLLEEETDLQDTMFEVVIVLMQNKSRLLRNLSTLIWKVFSKSATGKHIEQLLELASPNEREDEESESDEPGGQESDKSGEDEGEKAMDVDQESDSVLNKTAAEELLELDKKSKAAAEELLEADKKIEEEEEAGGEIGGQEQDEEHDMMKQIVYSVLQKKKDGKRVEEIERNMIPKIMGLLEVFADARVGDPLILTMVCPLLELYNQDPSGFTMARKILIRCSRKKKHKELPIDGVDMETIQTIIQDAIYVMKQSRTKAILDFVHSYVLLWLFKLYLRIAANEEKVAQAEKWIQGHYKDFWSGLVARENRFRYISLDVFRSAVLRFTMLVDPLLAHVFQTVKEEKITRPFTQFQTLCFISHAAVLKDKAIIDAFKVWHVEYAKTFCKMLPSLKKKVHIKTCMLNFIKFAKGLTTEEKRALLEGSNLEKLLSEFKGERAPRLLALLGT